MIKTEIINPELLSELAKLGHYDTVMICDIGYPIPADANRIDLSLISGIPSMPQVLVALLNTVVFESYAIVEDMANTTPDVHAFVTNALSRLPCRILPFSALQKEARNCKLYIRSGESRRKCNILLTSTSAAPHLVEQYDIRISNEPERTDTV